MFLKKATFILCVFALTGMSVDAKAASDSNGVIETHTESRHKDTNDLLAPFHDELSHRGYAVGSVMSSRIHNQHSITGKELSSDSVRSAKKHIDEGKQAYIGGQMEGAIDSLNAGLDLFMAAPATVARQPDLRDSLYLAHVYLALANNRLGKESIAKHHVEEFLRSFPDREVSSRRFGPEAAELFRKAGKDILNAKRGTLKVSLDNQEMVTFIDERYVGVGDVSVELPPGRYRVFTQKGPVAGRVHWATVLEGQSTEKNISSEKDRLLSTDKQFASMVFLDSEQKRRIESKFSMELATALNLRHLVLVEVQSSDIVATLIESKTRSIVRSGSILIPRGGAPSPKNLRALASFIAGDEPSTQVSVKVGSVPEPLTIPTKAELAPRERDLSSSTGGISKSWRYTAWGLGVASIGAGAYLLSIHGEKLNQFNQDGVQLKRKTQNFGIAAIATGAVLTLTGCILWTQEGNDSSNQAQLFVAPSEYGVSAGVFGRF